MGREPGEAGRAFLNDAGLTAVHEIRKEGKLGLKILTLKCNSKKVLASQWGMLKPGLSVR